MAERPVPFDPRITPARPDLAAEHLEGKVEATRFVEGALCQVVASQAPVRRAPLPDAPLDTEALRGELVTIYDANAEGWAWGQLAGDGYVGWLPASALGEQATSPTHKVAVPRTLVFPGPSIKLPPVDALSFGSLVAIERIEGPFAITDTHGYVPLRHLQPIAEMETDFVAVAERFIGVPYLWGGKSSLGLDCSALVQLSMTAIGQLCPRDSDMQERALGATIAPDTSDLRRGDLMFWKGHVAIVRDAATLIHANAFHMAVAVEPLAEAIARIGAAGSQGTSVRRIQKPA